MSHGPIYKKDDFWSDFKNGFFLRPVWRQPAEVIEVDTLPESPAASVPQQVVYVVRGRRASRIDRLNSRKKRKNVAD